MNFEFELSKGKQNSLGETLKVVDFIKKNPKKVEHLFQCFYSENSLVAMRAMNGLKRICLLYTSPSPRDRQKSRMPSSA